MQRYLLQHAAELAAQRPPGGQELVTFTESLAARVIEELTEPDDLVLDPFAGFGTTLVVAERLGRRALGVELLPERVAQVAPRLSDPTRVVQGDALHLLDLVHEPVDLVLTSPPYRTRNRHPEDPMAAYERDGGDYASYLADLGTVFGQVASLLRPGGRLAVNVANLRHEGVLTPLAWDLAGVVAEHLPLVHDCYLAWDSLPEEVTGDYLLVFGADA